MIVATRADLPRLHQVSAIYDPRQDRVVLRLSTSQQQEFRFWITRRFMGLLWRAIGRVQETFAAERAGGNPLLRSALADFAELKALSDADFKTPYAGGALCPPGEDPILLSRITLHPGPPGQQILRLTPEHGQGIDLALNESLSHILGTLLRRATLAADWALDLGAEDAADSPARPGIAPRRMH